MVLSQHLDRDVRTWRCVGQEESISKSSAEAPSVVSGNRWTCSHFDASQRRSEASRHQRHAWTGWCLESLISKGQKILRMVVPGGACCRIGRSNISFMVPDSCCEFLGLSASSLLCTWRTEAYLKKKMLNSRASWSSSGSPSRIPFGSWRVWRENCASSEKLREAQTSNREILAKYNTLDRVL